MDKAAYEAMRSEGEGEMVYDLILEVLGDEEQRCAKLANEYGMQSETGKHYYWKAIALKDAIAYIEDWKNDL